MYWGPGSTLGFLAILGYFLFVYGSVLLWYPRWDVPLWMNDEMGAIRRSLIRHAVIGSFGGLREEARFKLVPTGFLRRLGRLPRRRINRGAILLAVGLFLFFLDFLV